MHVIGMPMDFGQTDRGVGMGPYALRVAGLDDRLARIGLAVVDGGDVSCAIMATESMSEPTLRFLPAVAEGCRRLAARVAEAVRADHLPLILGGDHSVSIGTVAGLVAAGQQPGLIWIDAHGDFNDAASTPSGNIHGMALAVNLGRGDPRLTELAGPSPKTLPDRTVLVGVRELDPGERTALAASGVTVFTMRHVDELGMRAVMEKALAIAGRDTPHVHLSIDVDVLDPVEAPGVGTPVPGGITYREAHLALEIVADSGRLTSMEVVEVNPTLDDRNRTSELAVGLIASALGQRIL